MLDDSWMYSSGMSNSGFQPLSIARRGLIWDGRLLSGSLELKLSSFRRVFVPLTSLSVQSVWALKSPRYLHCSWSSRLPLIVFSLLRTHVTIVSVTQGQL